MKYTKETLIGEALDQDLSLSKYFMEMGMPGLARRIHRGSLHGTWGRL